MSGQTTSRRRAVRRLGTGASALFLMTAVAAQEHAVTLDEMVVVGSRAPAKISDLAGAVWVIGPEQIQSQVRAGATLKEALATFIPSLDVAPQSRTNFGQNMRGRSVLVMINGVSLNSSRGLSRQFDSIDPFNIARIEVLSGATALYGGGATGGIINIVTKRGEPGGPEFTSQVGASSGFNDSEDYQARVAQAVSGGSDFLQGRLGVVYQQNGAFYDADGKPILIDTTQTDLQYNRTIDVLGTLNFNLSAQQSLSVTAQFYDSRFNGDRGLYLGEDLAAIPILAGLFGNPPVSPEVRAGFDSDRVPATRRYLLTATYHDADLLNQEFYLQVFARREEATFHPTPGVADVIGSPSPDFLYYGASKQNTDVYGAKAVFVSDLDPVSLQWGVDVDRERFDSDQMVFDFLLARQSGGLKLDEIATVGRYPDYQVDTISGFLQAHWQATSWLNISAGIRQQHSEVEVDDFVDVHQQVAVALGLATSAQAISGGANDYDTTLFNVGAVFDLSLRDQLWARFSQGFEIPDPAKAYGYGEYDLVGGSFVLRQGINVDEEPLKGIKTHQVEIGWRHFGDHLTTQFATYYAWSDQVLSYDEQAFAVQVLDEKSRDYGIAGKLTYRFDGPWRLGASGHLVRSEQEVDGEWQKRDARFASPSKATAFVGWRSGGTDLRLQAIHSFDLEDDQGHEIEGFTTVDLLGSQKLPVGELSFGITNLLNEDYVTTWGQRAQIFYGAILGSALFDFHGRGRTYSFTYTVSF